MSRPLVLCCALLFALAALWPLALLFGRISAADLAAVLDARTLSLLGATLLLGAASALLALVLGLPFAWLVARTDLPGRSWLRPLGLVPLILPPLVPAMVWTSISELRGPAAAIFVLGSSSFPLVALFAARAFERIDARREEAALLAGGLGAVLRMELPLVAPALGAGMGLAFALTINDFAVPDYVSTQGPKINVYADELMAQWREHSSPGLAVASALPLLVCTLLALTPLLFESGARRATLDEHFRRAEPLQLGVWRWPAFALVFALLALLSLTPVLRLLFEAAGLPAWLRAGHGWSEFEFGTALQQLGAAFGKALDRARDDLRRSLLFAASAGLCAVPLALVLGHALARWSGRGRTALSALLLLPFAAPPVLLGVGFIAAWNRPASAALYDSDFLAVLLDIARFTPLALLALAGAAQALGSAQEDAAALSGAGPVQRLLRIAAPNLKNALLGAFLLVFVFAMRELDAAILVPAANRTAMFRLYNGVHFGRDDYVAALALLLIFALFLPGLLWSLWGRARLELLP